MVREFLVGLVVEGQRRGELLPGDPAVLAEMGLRLGLSFVLMPDSVLPLEDELDSFGENDGRLHGLLPAGVAAGRPFQFWGAGMRLVPNAPSKVRFSHHLRDLPQPRRILAAWTVSAS